MNNNELITETQNNNIDKTSDSSNFFTEIINSDFKNVFTTGETIIDEATSTLGLEITSHSYLFTEKESISNGETLTDLFSEMGMIKLKNWATRTYS